MHHLQTRTLVKIVGAHDVGGVRSCELAFTSHLRARGIRVVGVILGTGATASLYERAFDASIVVPCSLRSFGAGKLRRVAAVARNEMMSGAVATTTLDPVKSLLTSETLIGVGVRRPYYLKVAGLIGRALKTTVFWHMCDSVNDPIGRRYYHSLIGRYGLVPIGNSRYTIRTLLGADDTHGAFIYPGYWPDRLRYEADVPSYREQLGIHANRPVFSVVSRLIEEKAPDIVLEAFLRSEAFRGGAHLVLAGGPNDTEFARSLATRVAEAGRDRVRIIGEISDVGRLYASSDVVVNGRRNAEPFGISIVEAMSTGRPVIAYRKGGPEETIEHGSTGWLVNRPTIDDFTAAFDLAWSMRRQWEQMGAKARVAASRFSTEVQVDNYIELLTRYARSAAA